MMVINPAASPKSLNLMESFHIVENLTSKSKNLLN